MWMHVWIPCAHKCHINKFHLFSLTTSVSRDSRLSELCVSPPSHGSRSFSLCSPLILPLTAESVKLSVAHTKNAYLCTSRTQTHSSSRWHVVTLLHTCAPGGTWYSKGLCAASSGSPGTQSQTDMGPTGLKKLNPCKLFCWLITWAGKDIKVLIFLQWAQEYENSLVKKCK